MTMRERLILLREKKSLSQYGLAKASGVSASTILYLEDGRRKGEQLTVETARRLALALGVSLDYLCCMHEELTP